MTLAAAVFRIAADTAAFERSMTTVERRFDVMGTYARKFGSVLGVSLAASKFKDFVTGAIEAGDAMAKAATKAGANVEQFSELAYAAQLADVSLESLSNSVKFMQKAIATGNDSIGEIGVSLADLQRLEPDKQFEVLADAIAGIQDPAERTRRVLEIFGRAGSDLLPLFEQGADGIRRARLEAQQLGKVLTEENAKAIQEADDAIKRLKASYEAFAQTFAVKVVPAVTAVADSFRKLLGGATDLEKLESKLEFLERFNDSNAFFNPLLFNFGFDDGSGVIMTREQAVARMAEIRAEIAAKSSQAAGGDILVPITVSARRLESPQEAKRSVNAQTLLEVTRNYDYIDDLVDKSTQRAKEAAAGHASTLAYLNAIFNEQVGTFVDETRRINLENLEALADDGKTAMQSLSVFADEAARNMQSVLAEFLFDPFKDGLDGMLKGFVDVIRKMVAEAAAAKVFEKLVGSSGTGGGGLGSFLSSIFGGARAVGGPVSSGKSYLVGERGPEYFMPSTSGSIIPNNQLGGAPVINVTTHIDARGATSDLIGALPEILKRNNDTLESKIIDGIRRGRYGV